MRHESHQLCRLFVAALAAGSAFAAPPQPRVSPVDGKSIERIDAFVAMEQHDSGLPGVAIVVLQDGLPPHVRGFGHDGRGNAITADTPFPIGSITKSFTALLIRQQIETGNLDADAPVQQNLPWFRVVDPAESSRMTLRHLLHQTSGLGRADGMALLVGHGNESTTDLARSLNSVRLNHSIGERFEYSNLNYLLLGAILQATTTQPWESLVRERLLQPLSMSHTYTDLDTARRHGMTALHRMWFGVPVAQATQLPPGLAPAGGLVASANDMARYLQMLLTEGATPGGRVLSWRGVRQLLAAASPPATARLLSAEFNFRYGEGWFVGPFGAAPNARWHLGNLASFAAWAILLPDSKQAVAVLVNTNSELPFRNVNAVISRIPVGIVNLLNGHPAPQGPSLRSAYRVFNVLSVLAIALSLALAWWSFRPGRRWAPLVIAVAAVTLWATAHVAGVTATMLAAFAPDLMLVLAIVSMLLCLPLGLRAGRWARRALVRVDSP